jgi:hypothetical protein
LYYYRARYYSPTLQRFISEDPIGLTGGDTNFYAYVGNDPISFADALGLKPGRSWADTWAALADIRSAQKWWNDFHDEQIQKGNWVAATGGDILNGLITVSELPEVQSDGELLGSDASTGEKILASADLVRIGASWFFVVTGSEIVPDDPKKFRIAPAGNRAWRTGWEPVRVNQLPHYHRTITGPRGKTVPGGSIKWHRPWERGF